MAPEANKHLETTPFNLSFAVDDSRENHTRYKFDKVAVVVDDSGKNIKGVPEILFGTFESVPDREILSQPDSKIEGASMEYIAACIKKVSEVTGIDTFWFYPYGDDHPDVVGESSEAVDKRKARREAARQKLFSRFGTITPGPDNYGYILKI